MDTRTQQRGQRLHGGCGGGCAGRGEARAGRGRTTLTDREKLNLVVVRECSGERGDVDTGDLSSSSLPRSSSSSLMDGSRFFPEPISMSCCCTKGRGEGRSSLGACIAALLSVST